MGISRSITVTPGTRRIPISVEIIDDSVCEEKEMFGLLRDSLLQTVDPFVIVNDLNITITDDDCCALSIYDSKLIAICK